MEYIKKVVRLIQTEISPLLVGLSLTTSYFAIDYINRSEELFAAIVILVAVCLISTIAKQRTKRIINETLELINEHSENIQIREHFREMIEDKFLLEGQDLQSNWFMDILQKVWPTWIAPEVQLEMNKGYIRYTKNTPGSQFHEFELNINNKTVKFETFILNKENAPTLIDIQIEDESVRKDEIVMNAYISLRGNVHLNIQPDPVGTHLTLKDTEFRGLVRIVIRPLLRTRPFFGGFVFCFVDKPVMDFAGVELKRISDDPADRMAIKDFIADKVCHNLVTPRKLFVKYAVDSKSINQKLKFPIPIGVCYLHIIEAVNLVPAFFTNGKVGSANPFCFIRVSEHVEKTKLHYNTLTPLFEQMFYTPVHGLYEHCDVQIYSFDETLEQLKTNKTQYLGRIKFCVKDIPLNDSRNINGMDIWLPLEGTVRGDLHFRFAYFPLTTSASDIRDSIDRTLQETELDTIKMPVAVVSVFIDSMSPRIEGPKQNMKEDMPHVIEIKDSKGNVKYTREVIGSQEGFIWEEGFHFMYDDDPTIADMKIYFNFIGVKDGKKKIVASHTIILNESVINNGQTEEDDENKWCYESSNLRMKKSENSSGEEGFLKVFISLRAIKVDSQSMVRFKKQIFRKAVLNTESKRPLKYLASLLPICTQDEGEQIDFIRDEKGKYADSKCAVKFQFRFRNLALYVDVIRCSGVPQFDDIPNPAVVIEFWKSTMKVAQKSTQFMNRTRDPYYGRRFKFDVPDGNLARHSLRILVACRTGWIKKRVNLVAEAFCSIPPLDIEGTSQCIWIPLNTIGLKNLKKPHDARKDDDEDVCDLNNPHD